MKLRCIDIIAPNHGWEISAVVCCQRDDAKIVRLRGTYQVNPRLGARLIGEYSNQYNTIEPNPLYQHGVRYASSLLITYELAPASFLFAGYNDLMQEYDRPFVDRERVLRTGNQFFLKLSYLFRL